MQNFRRSELLIGLVVVAAFGLSGCATKGFVRKEVGTVNSRVDRVAADTDQAGRTARDAQGLARTGNERAQQAMSQAELAKEMALGHVRREEVHTAKVNFKFDSAELNDEAKSTLDEVAEEVKANPNYLVVISGFTDSTGDAAYNVNLAERRASTVNLYLAEKLGPEFIRLARLGFGEINPAAENDTREGRRENRRVEVAVVRPVPATGTEPEGGSPISSRF